MLVTLTVTTTGLNPPAHPRTFVGSTHDERQVSGRHPERWSTHHYRQAIRYAIIAGDTYRAGQTRYYAALLLGRAGRASEALAWATAALRDYQAVGRGAQTEAELTRDFINQLQQ